MMYVQCAMYDPPCQQCQQKGVNNSTPFTPKKNISLFFFSNWVKSVKCRIVVDFFFSFTFSSFSFPHTFPLVTNVTLVYCIIYSMRYDVNKVDLSQRNICDPCSTAQHSKAPATWPPLPLSHVQLIHKNRRREGVGVDTDIIHCNILTWISIHRVDGNGLGWPSSKHMFEVSWSGASASAS